MSLNIAALKAKLNQFNRQGDRGEALWKPTEGKHVIRIVPWKDNKENPFIELYFHYLGNKTHLSPTSYGNRDPIMEFAEALAAGGTKDDWAQSRVFRLKLRTFVPIIVRGEEDKGVQVWSFGKIVYQRMLGFFLDEEVGDILDPNQGFDLKVTITKAQGKQFNDTMVDPARRPSKLHEEQKTMANWLENVPNIDDMYRLKSTQEIEAVLNNWLNGGAPEDTGNVGTARGPAPSDALDDLVAEVKASAPEKPAKKPKKPDEDAAPAKKQSLDDAFADLMVS